MKHTNSRIHTQLSLLPFNIARARAVQDELIHIGFRESDLGHILTVDHDVHGTVQSHASFVERIVLAAHTPPGVALLGSDQVIEQIGTGDLGIVVRLIAVVSIKLLLQLCWKVPATLLLQVAVVSSISISRSMAGGGGSHRKRRGGQEGS